MNFDSWQRWGAALDAVWFANAWAALGLPHRDPTHRLPQRASLVRPEQSLVDWTYPTLMPPLGAPEEWARLWPEVCRRLPAPLRLRISHAPPAEPILGWFRLLTHAEPAPDAIWIRLAAPRADLHIGWPFRLGSISAAGSAVVQQLESPAAAVGGAAQVLHLTRESSACDVLVYPGSAKALLEELLRISWSIKANVILLHHSAADVWADTEALLAAILGQTRGSGFVLIPPTVGGDRIAETLAMLVTRLSQKAPLDVAFTTALRTTQVPDAIAGFTDDLATFDVRSIVTRYKRRLSALPSGALVRLGHVLTSRRVARGGTVAPMGGGQTRSPFPAPTSGALPPEYVPAASFAAQPEPALEQMLRPETAAEMTAAVAGSVLPHDDVAARNARFLQQQSFVQSEGSLQPATNGFIAGALAVVRVRIAVPEQGWNANPTVFPVETLPPDLESWTLNVWLSEPDHVPSPLKGVIELPRDGNSTECEFSFRPRPLPTFEGQLTVLHRGRVIQTAVLQAGVSTPTAPEVAGGAPRLVNETMVRHQLSDLEQRRRYDLAFVATHDGRGRPLLTAVSANAAWMKDLSPMPTLAAQINASLSPVAKSVQDYAQGLASEKGRALFVQLAQHGGLLRMFLNAELEDPANNAAAAKAEYIQIVSTKWDAVVPLEFAYDPPVPLDEAVVCPRWQDALAGRCEQTCRLPSHCLVCPLGFWGLSKVIERHAVRPGLNRDGNVLYLQSEPTRARDTLYVGGAVVLGSSQRIPEPAVRELVNIITRHSGRAPAVAKSWEEWETLVEQHHPALLLALAHTDGRKTNVTMEIGGAARKTITLGESFILPPAQAGQPHQAPIVALIGCDTAGTADESGNHVFFLRQHGAGIVIGTIATVFGEHAAKVAAELVQGMLPSGQDQPVRLGELMLSIRRKALAEGLLLPLCLVAYGDADWILSPKPPPNG